MKISPLAFFSKPMSRDQCKDTGMAMVLILLILTFFVANRIIVPITIAVLVISMAIPAILKPIAVLWFGLSHLLGTIMSGILLTLIFFVFVAPLGIIRRLLGWDPMALKRLRQGQESAMVERNHTFSSTDIEKPY